VIPQRDLSTKRPATPSGTPASPVPVPAAVLAATALVLFVVTANYVGSGGVTALFLVSVLFSRVLAVELARTRRSRKEPTDQR